MDTIIKFGKYKGQTLETMLKDKKYVEWVKTTDIPEKNPFLQRFLFPELGEPHLTDAEDEFPPEDSELVEGLQRRIDQLEQENRLLRQEIERLKSK